MASMNNTFFPYESYSQFQRLTLNDERNLVKQKTRRKPRARDILRTRERMGKFKNKPVVNATVPLSSSHSSNAMTNDVSENVDSIKIRAVLSQSSGLVFRIKKFGCKHIHKSLNLSSANNVMSHADRSLSSNSSNTNDSFNSGNSKSIAKENGMVPIHKVVSQHNSNLQTNVNVQSASLRNTKKNKAAKKVKEYPPYWSSPEVKKGLLNGVLIEGIIRINQKNSNESYVSEKNQTLHDYFIPSIIDRNRALEGDVVAIKLKSKEEWNEKQKTAFVVFIIEKVHSRIAIGCVSSNPNMKKKFVTFIPRDLRIPRIRIPSNSCPANIQNYKDDVLFRVKITSWPDTDFAQGIVTDVLGVVGDLGSEMTAILAEHNVDVTEFPSQLSNFTLLSDNIPEHELKNRLDLRRDCIFTIDPLTARDLDDAVSCRELPSGNFEVGVHISDVAFSLIEDTPLDNLVSKKATTVYLVNNVYHMLPIELCQKCSLLPGTDKRAFSVIWELTPTGEIIKQHFARTAINSCTQLAYEHAQLMIEDPNRQFQEHELPPIYGGFTYKDLSRTVNCLQQIALNLRKQRFDNGSLKIDQTKVLFRLNAETGEPIEMFTYENKDAHRLIEEFMLLANISVAKRIQNDMPDIAFLRCHDPPKQSMLDELQKNLNAHNVDIDISSSKALQNSILEVQDKLGVPQMAVLNHLFAKSMQRARYYCSSQNDGYLKHYALHVPIYTHFTSPIRRYADIMVHRLLAASLGYTIKPKWNVNAVSAIAENCNRQKYLAKRAGDASSALYLAHYVEKHQPFIKAGVVFLVRNHYFDILIPSTGSIVRISAKSFEKGMWQFKEENLCNKVTITFPETVEYCQECINIELFQTITVNLNRKSNLNVLEAQLLRPITSKTVQNSALP